MAAAAKLLKDLEHSSTLLLLPTSLGKFTSPPPICHHLRRRRGRFKSLTDDDIFYSVSTLKSPGRNLNRAAKSR